MEKSQECFELDQTRKRLLDELALHKQLVE
jgi:hypothetical protein